MLNKWDYRYPYFGLQKLHMGYGYGYPIYPQLSKHKDFMSLVNRLEDRMANIEDNVSNISQDVVDELHALLQQFNEIDTIISVDDVQLIVESAIDNIEYPEQISIDNVRDEITQAINQIDIGLSALEVQAMISDSIDELDVGLNEMQVKVIIHETLATIDTGLNYTQVQDLINLTLANLDVGMTEDDVTDLIQFHIQSIPIDSIQSELASLRTTIENLDTADIDLTDIYSRLLILESEVDEDTIYDDGWIHTEIQSLRDLIQGIETGDVDLTEVNSRLQALESKVDNDTIYDDGWIHTEIQSVKDLINAVETGEVNLTEVHSRLDALESKVDNDTIYDDTELRNLVNQLREDLDNLDVGDVDLSEVNSRLETLESKVDNDTIYDDEWIHTEIQLLKDLIQGIETGDVDLSEYVKHDQLAKEKLTLLLFTEGQSPQPYQIELSDSTVEVYITLIELQEEIFVLRMDYTHLNVDEQTELEEFFDPSQFNLLNINLYSSELDFLLIYNQDVYDVWGYPYEGSIGLGVFDLEILFHELPIYSPGDSIPLSLSFDINHNDPFNDHQPTPTQTININHDMMIESAGVINSPTTLMENIIRESGSVKENNSQIYEINSKMNYLEQFGELYPILENHVNNVLGNRITELENRLDNLVLPEAQTKDVAIVRPQGSEVYPERPDTELAIYIGPWEPDTTLMEFGDLWFNNTTGVYSMFTNEGMKQFLTGQVE